MSLSKYVLGFAQALENGVLIKSNLKKEDHHMHVMIASILRKSLKSEVMASVADDFQTAYMRVLQQNAELQAKIDGFTKPLNAEEKEISPEEKVESVKMVKSRANENSDATAKLQDEIGGYEEIKLEEAKS